MVQSLETKKRYELQRLIKGAMQVSDGWSNGAPSRRIEGQYGADSDISYFSHISIFIQYPIIQAQYELILELAETIFRHARSISYNNVIPSNIYLFNDQEQQILVLSKESTATVHRPAFTTRVAAFVPGDDHRRLTSFIQRNDKNTLYVFITDETGVEFEKKLKMNLNRHQKQSIWLKIDGDDLQMKKGFPELLASHLANAD